MHLIAIHSKFVFFLLQAQIGAERALKEQQQKHRQLLAAKALGGMAQDEGSHKVKREA